MTPEFGTEIQRHGMVDTALGRWQWPAGLRRWIMSARVRSGEHAQEIDGDAPVPARTGDAQDPTDVFEEVGSMDKDPIAVAVDRDLEDLIPGFLKRRQEDLLRLRTAREEGDMETLRVTGHSMKGTGGGYGFHGLSEIGAAVESAAKDGDAAAIDAELARLEDYLDRVQVRYE